MKYEVKRIYSKQFQKSKNFLLPLLGICRHNSRFIPLNTYLSYEDKVIYTDCSLIVKFKKVTDIDFMKYEQQTLIGNDNFLEYFEDSKSMFYVFSLLDSAQSYNNFILGKYSEIISNDKLKIKKFFGGQTQIYSLIDVYLYPEKYHHDYARILTSDKDNAEAMLTQIINSHELLEPPCIIKETLIHSKVKIESNLS